LINTRALSLTILWMSSPISITAKNL
jgi:hypothetical protein